MPSPFDDFQKTVEEYGCLSCAIIDRKGESKIQHSGTGPYCPNAGFFGKVMNEDD